MNAAIARDKSPDRLCESLYYMNEKLPLYLELQIPIRIIIGPQARPVPIGLL